MPAMQYGHPKLLWWLLAQGVPATATRDGATVLHLASCSTDMGASEEDAASCVHTALNSGSRSTRGAVDVDAKDYRDETALMLAAQRGLGRVRDAAAAPLHCSWRLTVVVHCAGQVVRFLLAAGASTDLRNIHGHTAADLAKQVSVTPHRQVAMLVASFRACTIRVGRHGTSQRRPPKFGRNAVRSWRRATARPCRPKFWCWCWCRRWR